MGQQFLSYTVETFSTRRDGANRLGDFRNLTIAISAARHALDDRYTTMAVVKDASGVMVYAYDGTREWTQDDEGRGVSAVSPIFGSDGDRYPDVS